MSPKKHPLRKERLRHPPREGWSWIDRRFLREKAPALDRDAILLYFFLAAVSDKDGLSYQSDTSIAGHLRLTESAVIRSREELQRQDLIAYQRPLYQVLSLSSPPPIRGHSEPKFIGEIFPGMARRLRSDGNPALPGGETR